MPSNRLKRMENLAEAAWLISKATTLIHQIDFNIKDEKEEATVDKYIDEALEALQGAKQ